MQRKDLVKISVAGVLVVLAVVIFFAMRPSPYDTRESTEATTTWYCLHCKAPFELTAKQAETRIRQEVVEEEEGDAGGPRPYRHGPSAVRNVVQCTKCNEWKGVEAITCPECKTVFPAKNEDGSDVECPSCGWTPPEVELRR